MPSKAMEVEQLPRTQELWRYYISFSYHLFDRSNKEMAKCSICCKQCGILSPNSVNSGNLQCKMVVH